MDSKAFYTSKTVIGIFIAALGFALDKLFHFQLTNETIEALSGGIPDLIDKVLQGGGLLLALYGRVKADKKLSVK